MKKITLTAVLVFLALTAYPQTGKWKETLQKNTREGYLEFLSKYPDSKYSNDAKAKIVEFEEMEKLLKEKEKLKVQENRKRSLKLDEYEVGILTFEQFMADGWNGTDPWTGTIGIIKLSRSEEKIVVLLGICSNSGSSIASQMWKFAENALITTDMPIDYNMNAKDKDGNDGCKYICTLIFTSNILSEKISDV